MFIQHSTPFRWRLLTLVIILLASTAPAQDNNTQPPGAKLPRPDAEAEKKAVVADKTAKIGKRLSEVPDVADPVAESDTVVLKEASGYGGRGSGSRKAMLASGGGTRQSERAVAAALNWLARHQLPNGSWSLKGYNARCKDATCTGPGNGDHDSGGTAMGLLPFLAAGQTHESKGPYQRNIKAGVYWLLGAQKPNGDLRAGSNMYSHGLASIALCECYGMTGDKKVGRAAQKALDFIVAAQDQKGGGWRYAPGDAGDTSVLGWQIMALKSGQMAYLNVNPAVFEKAKEYLKSASSGQYGGQFGYMAGGGGTTTMTGVGLLCSQYLKVPKDDPAMRDGTAFLMKNMPDNAAKNVYYWYYATQVMHNIRGPDWYGWNPKMRQVLIDTQTKEGCASGSWDPKGDQWGSAGGRVMTTSLSALILEVYYRYPPVYYRYPVVKTGKAVQKARAEAETERLQETGDSDEK